MCKLPAEGKLWKVHFLQRYEMLWGAKPIETGMCAPQVCGTWWQALFNAKRACDQPRSCFLLRIGFFRAAGAKLRAFAITSVCLQGIMKKQKEM